VLKALRRVASSMTSTPKSGQVVTGSVGRAFAVATQMVRKVPVNLAKDA